jgi:glycosyltransferase involved in cell wall biosynthesis
MISNRPLTVRMESGKTKSAPPLPERESNNAPTVSVVIPCYNAQSTILQTIKSLNEPFLKYAGEFELIFVDDGSSDQSMELFLDWAESHQREYIHSRIRVVRQSNSGLGAARNIGIAEAKGEWLIFLDSDDALCAESWDYIFASQVFSLGMDVIQCEFLSDGFQRDYEYSYSPQDFRRLLDGVPGVWRNIYRRDFLAKNDVVFPKVFFIEDLPFLAHIISVQPRFTSLQVPLVNYNPNTPNSLTNMDDARWLELVPRLKEVRAYLKGDEYDDLYASLVIRHLTAAYLKLPKCKRRQMRHEILIDILAKERPAFIFGLLNAIYIRLRKKLLRGNPWIT